MPKRKPDPFRELDHGPGWALGRCNGYEFLVYRAGAGWLAPDGSDHATPEAALGLMANACRRLYRPSGGLVVRIVDMQAHYVTRTPQGAQDRFYLSWDRAKARQARIPSLVIWCYVWTVNGARARNKPLPHGLTGRPVLNPKYANRRRYLARLRERRRLERACNPSLTGA